MVGVLLQFATAGGIIVAAAILLTGFADVIATRTGLSRAFVGSLFLASATSLPEIVVDFNAIGIGEPDLAVGDLLGSSLFNLLILTVVSTMFLLPTSSSSQSVQHAVAAVLSMMVTSIIAFGLLVDLEFSFLRAGFFTWSAFFCYLLGLRLLFHHGRSAASPPREETLPVESGTRLGKAIAGYAACAMVILLAAPYLTDAADRLAVLSGLGHSFVGTTFVALSTSLPELAATATALRMRFPDLALGNIFGSNLFNMAIFLPLDWYYPGDLLRDAAETNVVSSVGIILSTSLCVVTLLYPPARRKHAMLANGLVGLSVLSVLALLYGLRLS